MMLWLHCSGADPRSAFAPCSSAFTGNSWIKTDKILQVSPESSSLELQQEDYAPCSKRPYVSRFLESVFANLEGVTHSHPSRTDRGRQVSSATRVGSGS